MGFAKIKENVYLLRVPHGGTTTGVILLRGEKNYLIDAGGNADEVDRVILPALADLSLSLSDIECLIPTHTHADHIGGFPRMRALGIPRIAAYERSVPKLSDPYKYNVAIRKAFPENSPPPSPGLSGVRADVSLADGDVIDGRLEILATPGHDDDAICIFDRLTETLVCGDSVQHNGTLVQGCGAYMDLAAYRKSMQRLSGVPAKTAVLGHPFLPHGDVIDGAETVHAFLREALELTYVYRDFVREQVKSGETDLCSIARHLIENVGGVQPEYLFLPLYTVREHMAEVV